MLTDNISLPASPLATTLMCELLISVKDQTRTVLKQVNASVVLNGPVTNLWAVRSLIPESLSFTSTGNPVRFSPRISADELLQTLSYCQGEFQG